MSPPPRGPAERPSYARALDAYRRGDLTTALRLLDGLDFERPTILRVRVLTRLGRLPEALRAAVDAPLEDAGDRERAELNTVYADVAVRLGRDDVATALDDAQLHVDATGAHTLAAELDTIRARHALIAGELDAAETFANRVAAPGDDDASGVPHRDHVRAEAFALLSRIAQSRGRLDAAALRMRDAVDAGERAPVRDRWIVAHARDALSALQRLRGEQSS